MLDSFTSKEEEEELTVQYQKEHDMLEQQKKTFDDLEFQQLEVRVVTTACSKLLKYYHA